MLITYSNSGFVCDFGEKNIYIVIQIQNFEKNIGYYYFD